MSNKLTRIQRQIIGLILSATNTTETLAESLYGCDDASARLCVYVHISYLRRKGVRIDCREGVYSVKECVG